MDVLINNAGAIWQAPLEDYPDSAWDKLWNINVKGVFYLTVALLPQLRAAASADNPARVINLGSVDADQVPSWETYAYAASKAGVHMLTRHLGHQLAAEHITVNGIVPGPFQSNMTTGVLDTEGPREELLSRVALGREGTWEDAAGVAIFLASRASSFLTGALIPMDGGMSTTTDDDSGGLPWPPLMCRGATRARTSWPRGRPSWPRHGCVLRRPP